MLDKAERHFVETTKMASTLKIVINENQDDELVLKWNCAIQDIKKLSHDVALALQDYFNHRKWGGYENKNQYAQRVVLAEGK